MDTAHVIAHSLSPESKAFLVELCKIAGNQYSTPDRLEYYRSDLYTWYDARDLMPAYSHSQIGGFLSNYFALGIVDGKGREAGITAIGVEVAIIVTTELAAKGIR